MAKTVHIIWHAVKHGSISDAREVVGVVTTGWQDADRVVEKFEAADDEGRFRGRRYWKEEVEVLNPDMKIEF